MCGGAGAAGGAGGAGGAGNAGNVGNAGNSSKLAVNPDTPQGDVTGNPQLNAFTQFLRERNIRLQ